MTIWDELDVIRGFKYLAIDPGKTSGWALFDTGGNLRAYGQTEDLYVFLRKIDPKPEIIIYEDFIYNPRIKQGGQRQWSGIGIGHVEAYVKENEDKIKIHKQLNHQKESGYLWAGILKTKNHRLSHERDAIA